MTTTIVSAPTIRAFLTDRFFLDTGPHDIRHRDFSSLVMERFHRYIDGRFCQVVGVVEIVARHPGQGSWRRLFWIIRRVAPGSPVWIDSVVNDRFRGHLERSGFRHEAGTIDYIFVPQRS